jgi:hypothetical protein
MKKKEKETMRQRREAKMRSAKAGSANLQRWLKNNPDKLPALKHGGYSRQIHHRYSDGRYREAKQLNSIVDQLKADLGGEEALTASHRILLANIRSKLIIIFQVLTYIIEQESVIKDGELLPVLRKGFTTYSESLRRDLEALHSVPKKPPSPTYDQIMKELREKNKRDTDT